MNKEFFLALGEEVDFFEIIDSRKAPTGLTKETLWHLWNIVVSYGYFPLPFREMPLGISYNHPPLHMSLWDPRRNKAKEAPDLYIIKQRASGMTEEGTFSFEVKNGLIIIWDKGVTTDYIQEIIEQIDAEALSRGHKKGDVRVILEGLPQYPKTKVDDFFEQEGDFSWLLVPPGQNPKQFLDGFDQPERLALISFGPFQIVCLKSEEKSMTIYFDESMKAILRKIQQTVIQPTTPKETPLPFGLDKKKLH